MAGIRWWICPTNEFEGTVMIANVRCHSPVFGLRQFSHRPAKPKDEPSFMALLGPRALNSPPLEEAVDRHDAAPLSISFAKCGELGNALGLGIDGPTATRRVCEPIRDQTPLDEVERALTSLAVLPNNEQLLAGRCVVAAPNVPHPAVADLEAIDDGQAKDWSSG